MDLHDSPDKPPPPTLAALPEPDHLLFTYGTLMLTTGIPEVDAVLRDAGTSLGRGWIHGRLFDLGEYPGAVAASPVSQVSPVLPGAGGLDEDAQRIWGRLMHLKDPAGFYSVIDGYEGFDAGDRSGSEFVRARTLAFLPGRDPGIPCQVYWYNRPIQGRPVILSGDYLAHWKIRGKPVQRRTVS